MSCSNSIPPGASTSWAASSLIDSSKNATPLEDDELEFGFEFEFEFEVE